MAFDNPAGSKGGHLHGSSCREALRASRLPPEAGREPALARD
jgi:hypothetical protein